MTERLTVVRVLKFVRGDSDIRGVVVKIVRVLKFVRMRILKIQKWGVQSRMRSHSWLNASLLYFENAHAHKFENAHNLDHHPPDITVTAHKFENAHNSEAFSHKCDRICD